MTRCNNSHDRLKTVTSAPVKQHERCNRQACKIRIHLSSLLRLPRGSSLSRRYRISFQPLSECTGHRFIILSSFATDHFEFSSPLIVFHEAQLEHRESDAILLESFSRTFSLPLLPPYPTQPRRSTTDLCCSLLRNS